MNRLLVVAALTTIAFMLGMSVGCSSAGTTPDDVSWRLVERRADPTGREAYSVEVAANASRASGAAVIVPGMIVRQVEVDRWNVYECQETRSGYITTDVRRRIVVDPIGKQVPDADPYLTAASIKGIEREVTGPQFEPADYQSAPVSEVVWNIPALKDAGRSSFGGTTKPDSWGKFEIRIDGETLKDASRLPTGQILVVVTASVSPSGQQSAKSTSYAIPRSVFVQAAENGQ